MELYTSIKLRDNIEKNLTFPYIQYVLEYKNVVYIFVKHQTIFQLRNKHYHMKNKKLFQNVVI